MNKQNIYYRMSSGELCRSDSIEEAFWICSGTHRADDEGAYIRFLDSLFRKGILQKAIKPTYGGLIDEGHRTWAIMQYRDDAGCGLIEAKLAIDTMYPRDEV